MYGITAEKYLFALLLFGKKYSKSLIAFVSVLTCSTSFIKCMFKENVLNT